MANDLIAKPGTPVAVRIAEVQAAPAHKVKDLATHVYKKPDGTPLMSYYEALQRPRQEVIDAIISYEVATGVLVNDGGAAQPPAAPAPTPVAASVPAPVAAAAPASNWAPAPTPVAIPPQVGQVPPTALEPVQSPRPSRRSQAKAAQAAAPAPAPTAVAAPIPEPAAPPPTPIVAPQPVAAVPPTPVITRMEAGPVPPSAPSFPVVPPSAPTFVPPTPVAAPVVAKAEAVDLGPVVARLDKVITSVTNLDAKTDHMLFVLYHLFSGMYGQTVQQNNIKTFSDFKKYIQAISNPQ